MRRLLLSILILFSFSYASNDSIEQSAQLNYGGNYMINGLE